MTNETIAINCKECKHDGNQSIFPSACTGCGVDREGTVLGLNFEPMTKKISDEEIESIKYVLSLGNMYAEYLPAINALGKLIAHYRDSERSAFLWNTFVSNQRIRTLGWSNLGEHGYQHMGFEIWTMYGMPEDNYDFTEETSNSIAALEKYLDAWAATQLPEKDDG